MPTLDQHSSADFTKLLFIGSSGTGKTGALVSLVAAGYKLRIIDLDSGLDALVNFARQDCPDKMKNIQYETRRDKYKAGTQGPQVVPPAKAFVECAKLLDKWTDDSKPEEWGPQHVLVIDSLTNLGRAAFEWARAQNPTSRDPRQWYKGAQDVIENVVAALTSDIMQTNVIVISHVDLVEDQNGLTRGYVSSIGKALGPKIPRYFNTMVLAETIGSGKNVRRVIKTVPTGQIDLKNPAPMRIEGEYPLASGLATIFEKLKGK